MPGCQRHQQERPDKCAYQAAPGEADDPVRVRQHQPAPDDADVIDQRPERGHRHVPLIIAADAEDHAVDQPADDKEDLRGQRDAGDSHCQF